MGAVYVLTSPSGKRYVGMTQRDIDVRWSQHSRLKSDRPINRAIQKYGWECFKREVVMQSDDVDDLVAKECALIAEYGCMVPDGYNCTSGGEGISQAKRPPHVIEAIKRAHLGKIVSEETRAKLRAARAKNPRAGPMAGKKHSAESLAKMRGRSVKHSDATKQKMSQSRIGHSVSAATREKLRLSASSQPLEVRQRIAESMRRIWAERRANG